MRVDLDKDETWALLSYVVHKIIEDVPMPEEERGRIRRWRSEVMKPSGDAIRALTVKVNEDLDRAASSKERSPIRRPDWN